MDKALNFMGMVALIWWAVKVTHWTLDYVHARSLPVITEDQILKHLGADAFSMDIESTFTSPFPADFEFPALLVKIHIPFDSKNALILQRGHHCRLASPALLETLVALAFEDQLPLRMRTAR